jgi:hypothetical protein
MKGRDYAALGPLSAKLKELGALDLTAIPGAGGKQQDTAATATAGREPDERDGADDPVVVVRCGGDDDGATGPVIVSSRRS